MPQPVDATTHRRKSRPASPCSTDVRNRIELIRRPLRNTTCPYCGEPLSKENQTKEHVVGRRFVPKGTLDGSVNVILNACERCNRRKADLEDELSTLSMYPDLMRGHEEMGALVADNAKRKLAKSRSRSTRKLIADSTRDHTIESRPLPGLTMTLSVTSPPQMDEARVYELAHYQIRGFFYALTYNSETRLGGFWPGGGFFPVWFSSRTDWGNPIQTWFMRRVLDWHERVVGYFADQHFRVAIRRCPESEFWSFALEWNRNTRVIGFFGVQAPADEISKEIPHLDMVPIGKSPDGAFCEMRFDVPLREADDVLFYIHEPPAADE